MNNNICQSCGMPMNKDPYGGGTNKNGSKNIKYCSFCYRDGEFTFRGTVKDFQTLIRGMLIQSGNSKFSAWYHSRKIKKLERWRENGFSKEI